MEGRWRSRLVIAGLGLLSLAGYAVGVARVAASGEHIFPAYVALFGGLFVLYGLAAGVVLRRPRADGVLLGLILAFGLLFRLAVLPTPVFLSSDVYRYLWDGRVQRAGINPYRFPPAAEELAPLRDPVIYPKINRPTKRTVYPPGTEALFAAVGAVAPDSLLGWRLFLLACEIATVGLLLRLLRRMGVPCVAVLLYAWAPLVVFEGVQAGHLEVALIPVLLLALGWRQAGRLAQAGAALGLAVLLKLYPAVLLVAWWRRGDRRLGLACAAVVATGYLLYAWGVGPQVVGFLPEYFGSAEDFNIGLRYFLTGWLPLQGLAREVVRGITMLVLGAVLLVVLGRIARDRREDAAGIFRVGMGAAAAYLVLVPTAMHAWYALWILPFATVRPSPAWLWWSGAVSLSYLTYAWGEFPFWVRALEFWPLYGLLAWEWWTGRAAAMPAAPRAEWRSGVTTTGP